MTILPKLQTKYGEGVGIELFIEFPDLSLNEKSFFDADVASGVSSLTANGVNFGVGQFIVLGQRGYEKSEIIRIHTSTVPSSTAITTNSNTVFAHNRGDSIRFIPYDQIIVERSTDAGVTFTPLSAINIRADALQTYLQRPADASTDVYRCRFYNSADSTYSAYSDSYTASGLADNTVGAIKQRALDDLGEQKSDLLTDSFLNQSLWTARRELDEDQRVLRWSFRTKFNHYIGQCISGRWKVSAPTDLRDPNTNKNILGIRIGKIGRHLEYKDMGQFFERYRNVPHSTLTAQITSGSTTLTLASTGNFDASGTIIVAAEDASGVLDYVTYTANNKITNTLSGVTGIDVTHASGRDVWQTAVTFGSPVFYTIFEGNIYFDIPFEDNIAGEDIVMDYYSDLVPYDSDADVLDEPNYDLFVSFLKWKIKYKKANGKINFKEDTDWIEWDRKKVDLINNETTGQNVYFVPDFNDYRIRR